MLKSLIITGLAALQFVQPGIITTHTVCLIETYSDTFVWKYKQEGGVWYKRLYNSTQDCWVGPWIKC